MGHAGVVITEGHAAGADEDLRTAGGKVIRVLLLFLDESSVGERFEEYPV